jgi:hypothetical protein
MVLYQVIAGEKGPLSQPLYHSPGTRATKLLDVNPVWRHF